VFTAPIDQLIQGINQLAPAGSFFSYPFNVLGMLALLLIGLTCGAVGSLVVGNRMAFFSDALAHCAFAGVALGLLLGVLSGADRETFPHLITLFMIAFGIVMGLAIALVRDNTSQANDTIIGVFFAGALGLGAIFLKAGTVRRYYPPEDFLFGSIVTLTAEDLVVLIGLLIVTGIVLFLIYNQLVFASFSPSLARSRNISVRLYNYVFIVLLALIVNLCLKIVGVLLINAMLIVPAAAAANLCRNMRQLFICSVFLCILSGVLGQWLSWELAMVQPIELGESGTIVVFAVILYFLSMIWKSMNRPRPKASEGGDAADAQSNSGTNPKPSVN
jgi:zinc transport system permease protein